MTLIPEDPTEMDAAVRALLAETDDCATLATVIAKSTGPLLLRRAVTDEVADRWIAAWAARVDVCPHMTLTVAILQACTRLARTGDGAALLELPIEIRLLVAEMVKHHQDTGGTFPDPRPARSGQR